jgi:hypothetical protein
MTQHGYAARVRGSATWNDTEYVIDTEGMQALVWTSGISEQGCTPGMICSVMEHFSLGYRINEQLLVPLSELKACSVCVLGRRLATRTCTYSRLI